MKAVTKRKIDELFRTYCITHGVKESFENFLTWLEQENLIDGAIVEDYISKKEKK